MRAQKTLATFLKYLFWTVVAAAIKWTIDNIGNLNIPIEYVPLVAAVLKSIATWVATQDDAQ